MSYSWGYIKNATLSKLDISANAAIEQGLIDKFPYLANEVITQVCSAVKPKRTFAEFKVERKADLLYQLCRKYYQRPVEQVDLSFLSVTDDELLDQTQMEFKYEYESYVFVGSPVSMPADFISFGSDVSDVILSNGRRRETSDEDYVVHGYGQVVFLAPGTFYISYNARWFTFLNTTDDNVVLPIPMDILDCLPSYIASQCLKIDDEQKSIIYRNEFELMLSRIDASSHSQNRTIKISGGW